MGDDDDILEQWFMYKGHIEFLGVIPTVQPVSHVISAFSEGRCSDRCNLGDATGTDHGSVSEDQGDHGNGETAGQNDDGGEHSPSPSNAINDTVSRDGSSREVSSTHARGGGLGSLLLQCFGLGPRHRPGRPRYRVREQHISPSRPRRHRRHHRARHRSNRYSGSNYHRRRPRHRGISPSGSERGPYYDNRHDRHESYPSQSFRSRSLSPRRRNAIRPPVPKAATAPNYDAMSEDELFNTLLTEERGLDPMLRDVDDRRTRGEEV